ncbi:MAG: putative metal-binding motif-containing protein, partial [Deltaproteobacteria bacterium]|nr:putative metal-binding motif-containing protein [Deltaproteobacteria bacterium]
EADPLNAPSLTEVCDLQDNICDTQIDEGFDADGDGVSTCAVPEVDCDDNNPNTYPGAVELCDADDNDCDGTPGNTDADGDGASICDDCDDADPLVFPGAGFPDCDGTDWDCDGVPETEVRVAFLPGQATSWANLPALVSLDIEATTYGGCDLTFADVASPVTEAALVASAAHVALLSSPGEGCSPYSGAERTEIGNWLSGDGRGIVITGTLGSAACSSYNDRYELATLAGVTLNFSGNGTSVPNTVSRVGAGVFWDGLGTSFSTGGDPMGDAIVGTCTGAVIDGQVGGSLTTIAYTANPSAPCLAGAPMDHRGAWLPFQPEDGGSSTDRRYLYNVLDWLKSL